MIGLAVSANGSATQQAFLEENPEGVVIEVEGQTPEQVGAVLMNAGVRRLVPGTPRAARLAHLAASAAGLPGPTVPLDRAALKAADRSLPTDHFSMCVCAADVEAAITRAGRPVLLRPVDFGDADPGIVCSSLEEADEALSRVSPRSRAVAIAIAFDRRLSVDVVSRAGAHVNAGVYEHRIDLRVGREELRHRISLPLQDEAAAKAWAYARDCLDGLGVVDGATCVEIELTSAGQQLVDVSPAPVLPAIPADAAFTAFGHSHQHLYVESLLRPRDFERRLVRPLSPGRTTLAIAPLHNWRGSGAAGFAGLRLLRRLTGFHSVTPFLSSFKGSGPVAIASFVHADRASVENSLAVLHEYEDSHAFFAVDDELIGFAAAAS